MRGRPGPRDSLVRSSPHRLQHSPTHRPVPLRQWLHPVCQLRNTVREGQKQSSQKSLLKPEMPSRPLTNQELIRYNTGTE